MLLQGTKSGILSDIVRGFKGGKVLGYCHLVAIPHHQVSGSSIHATISGTL